MKTLFGRLIIVVLILALLLTIGDIVLTYQNLVIVHDNASLVNRTFEINSELDKTLISLVNAETQHRAFLITGDSKYLDTYASTSAEIQKHIDLLQQITQDNQSAQKIIPVLRKKTNEWLALLKGEIDIYTQQGFYSAQTFLKQGQGQNKMKEVRDIIAGLEKNENTLLTLRQQQTEKSYLTLFASSALTGLSSLVFILLTYYSIGREIAKRTELEKNKDEFFNMASHELKTPITSLNIFIHVLERKIDMNQKTQAKRYLAKISAQTDKLTALISDFLDLARVQTGKMKYTEERFNLNELINETIDEIKGTTKKHTITVKGVIKESIFADKYRIYQVLVNLLTNAVKYSPKGGKITVTAKKDKKFIVVSVQDQGIGVEKKFQDKIFDRLYQVSDPSLPAYPGFGIGLFVSKEIIRHHRGKIWVVSPAFSEKTSAGKEKEKGSTFSFSLPLTVKRRFIK